MNVQGPSPGHLKVLVTDTDAMTTHLLAADLQRQQQFEVVPCASSLNTICDCIEAQSASILLIGVKFQDLASDGVQVLKRIRNRHPGMRSIALLESVEPELISELFRAGVRGVYERSEYDAERLCRCIQCVSAGQIWAKSEHLVLVLDAFAETTPTQVLSPKVGELLTPRERDVVRLVADGFGNREIAQQLGLSAHTIKNYLFNVFDKLGISSRAELIMFVLSNARGLLNPSESDESRPKREPLRSSRSHTYPVLAG
jgi:DNA-binding NarL/FixJ family response regulator